MKAPFFALSALAFATAVASTAVAEPVRLTDAEMDRVAAATGFIGFRTGGAAFATFGSRPRSVFFAGPFDRFERVMVPPLFGRDGFIGLRPSPLRLVPVTRVIIVNVFPRR